MIQPIRIQPAPISAQEPRQQEARSGTTGTEQLSTDERQMIDSVFPARPGMTMRLYGPARPLAQISGGIGTRIDLKG